MWSNNGRIDLNNISSRQRIDEEVCRSYVPHFFGGRHPPNRYTILNLVNRYPGVSGPCSMNVDSIEELAGHMAAGYQVSHFHYILGKKYDLKGSFPNWCCGTSSRSVVLSLIEFGYPNATYAYSRRFDHGYVLLPFVLEKEGVTGSIVIDPTYDQLWKRPHGRNAVFIKLGVMWSYRTDWKKGGDLFPDNLCSIDTMRLTPDDISDLDYYHKYGIDFFEEAFANPLPVGYRISK